MVFLSSETPIQEGSIVTGPLFNEPMRVETVRPSGHNNWTVGLVGTQSERFRKVTLTSRDIETLKHDVTELELKNLDPSVKGI